MRLATKALHVWCVSYLPLCLCSLPLVKAASQGGHFAHILNSGFVSKYVAAPSFRCCPRNCCDSSMSRGSGGSSGSLSRAIESQCLADVAARDKIV